MLTLFHAPQSRSSRFIWLLEELGEPYEIEYVGIRRGDRTGARDPNNPHPHGKVPALVHDGSLVTESAAICLYLSDAFPKAGLGPVVGDKDRGAYVTWLAYYAGVIEPAQTARWMRWEVTSQAGWPGFEEMEAHLAESLDGGGWALGERFSTVDVLLGSTLQWAQKAFPQRPQYDAYREKLKARPALQRALARDAAPA